MSPQMDLETWLRDACSRYSFDLRGVFRSNSSHGWPVVANNADELNQVLDSGGHLLPLPKEPAALANVVEVSIVDYLLEQVELYSGVQAQRGTERGYPDLEFTGPELGKEHHAVDIKVARRLRNKSGVSKNTASRITLYTGNTYFRYPKVHWPGTFRPFEDYKSHLDILVIYTLNEDSNARVEDLEVIVQPAWKIASKQRSSTTREYIGAVVDIDDLRNGRGEFSSAQEFYAFWRKYPFKIGQIVQRQLDKLLA